MERLKKQRRPVRAALTKCITEVDVELAKENPDRHLLGVYFKRLERIINDLQDLDDEISIALLDANCTDEEQDEERNSVDEYRDRAEMARLKINEILDPKPRSPSPSTYSTATENGSKKKSFKLPKIELPKFTGKLKDWLGWWSQFEKIDQQEDLHQSDKFQYLIQATESKTEAREIVDSFPPTGNNYELAIKALKKRYGREDLQLQVYLRELLSLVITNAGKKEKVKVEKLYLKLESALRALNTLNLSKAEPSMYFYPLVESSLPEDILRAWQRSPMSKVDPDKDKLGQLMKFLEAEVEGEQQITLAKSGFSNEQPDKNRDKKKKVNVDNWRDEGPTAAGLAAATKHECIFCELTNHPSQNCFKARNLTIEQKNQKIKEKRACFRCLKPGHSSKSCKSHVKCLSCGKNHETVMCQHVNGKKEEFPKDQSPPELLELQQQQLGFAISHHNNLCQEQDILLKVVVVKVTGPKGSKKVRMLIDEGSQVSYIGSRTVTMTGCKSLGVEYVKNMLLGGVVTDLHEEHLREVVVSDTKGNLSKNWTLREKSIVCTGLPRIPVGKWMESLKQKKIIFSDLETVHVDENDIEILIGSDLRGEVMTGRRYDMGGNLFAEETIFGWTLGGPVPCIKKGSFNMNITLLQHREYSVQDMWALDVLGIQDPIQVKTKLQAEEDAKKHFLQNVRRNEDGRYCVRLPWICDKPYLPSNEYIAEKRLQSTTRKLKMKQAVEVYDGIFRGWEEEGIVESVHVDLKEKGCHYLPHHPVFKPESKTTPIRPVFDASCKSAGNPSLNDCLYKGPNLIELIPSVLHRFRERNIGVVSDIRKAFQMIEVHEEDRDYQRFLWWTDSHNEKKKTFRHTRVVFGQTCSPFLLGAVLELHLTQGEEKMKSITNKLLHSMYVDNSVTSVDTIEEYRNFREVSIEALKKAKMELRQWEVSGIGPSRTNDGCGLGTSIVNVDWKTRVLGLVWDRESDTLSCDVEKVIVKGQITKRNILSAVAKIFDPIGFTCPVTLQPKLLLQELWKTGKGWDEDLEYEEIEQFMKWCQDVYLLSTIQIPRQMRFSADPEDVELHLFTDASSRAYAAAIFLRSSQGFDVRIQLVQAKARVAPLKKGTIPRLELMGCLIGTRLLELVRESLDFEVRRFYNWTDSTTALAWILRAEEWGTFVANRVKEIRKFSSPNWRHVPGELNPADLPSRGCSSKQLLESKWWEGMEWLKLPEDQWPFINKEVDEDEISKELKGRKKTILQVSRKEPWFRTKFSTFYKNVQVMGWIIRFVTYSRIQKYKRPKGEGLSLREHKEAELKLFQCIQRECLTPGIQELNKKLPVVSKNGLYCVKTRLLNKEDTEYFRWPIILPSDHPIVQMMVRDLHLAYCHPGLQFLACKLREKFWILGGRRAIKSIVRQCPKCRRFDAKPICVEPAALPADRVTCGEVFETTGVDLAGPLALKDGSKAWVVLPVQCTEGFILTL